MEDSVVSRFVLRDRANFTLIELLAVIGIIAILAGLLMPALARARDQAKAVSCISGVKQIGLAFIQYAGDYDGWCVQAYTPYGTTPVVYWCGTQNERKEFEATGGLMEYLGESRRIRLCPALPKIDRGFNTGCGGYGYNDYYLGGSRWGPAGEIPWRIRITQIPKPAETIAFADSIYWAGGAFQEQHTITGPKTGDYAALPNIHFRHAGSANFGWSDGHVSPEKLSYTQDGAYKAHNIGWPGEDKRGTAEVNYLFDLK